MPRYFFDIIDKSAIARDVEGQSLANLDAVLREVIESAREMMGAAVADGCTIDHPPFG